MNKKNTVEDELNAIRIDLYERTKDMTPSERVSYLKKLSSVALKEYGLRTQNGSKDQERLLN